MIKIRNLNHYIGLGRPQSCFNFGCVPGQKDLPTGLTLDPGVGGLLNDHQQSLGQWGIRKAKDMTDVPSGLAATQLLLSQKTSRASQKVWASTNDPSCEIRRQQIHVQKAYKNIISHDISLSCFLVVLFDSSTSGLKKHHDFPPRLRR